ncbi:hypothetical protein BDW75DRAFT_235668 [Aspergillus navahoensis]
MAGDAPFVITATDKSGLIAIAATLFMSWMVIVCLIRLYMRLTMNGPLGMDDWAAFSAGVIGVVHVAMIMDGLSHGLGRSHQDSPDSKLQKAGKVVIIYGKSSLPRRSWFSKDIEKAYLLACKTSLLTASLWSIASIVAVALSCSIKYIWSVETDCRGLNTAWKAITAFDVLTEVFLISLSVSLVWAVQMRRKEKMTVIFAFGTRILVIIPTIVRQSYLNTALKEKDAPSSLSDTLIATEVLLHCSIMLATVPCLKPFIIAFNTGWGQGVTATHGTSYYRQTESSPSQAHPDHPKEQDELDVAMRTRSLEKWTLREEIEMRPMGG